MKNGEYIIDDFLRALKEIAEEVKSER